MSQIKVNSVGIVMNGVTGRMGTNQHLLRSICAIMKQGGVKISDSEVIMPEPVLVGRNEVKLQQLADRAATAAGLGSPPVRASEEPPRGGATMIRFTTDLDAALAEESNVIYFDAQTTDRRVDAVTKAIKLGKHVYCEKPTAMTTKDAYKLYQLAKKAGVKHGVVQDKLWLPGLLKLQELIHRGFFGRILSVRGEFGYWVFEGDTIPLQRPSWNYRKEDGGGVIVDMLCHWRYVIDNIFGPVRAVSCLAATHIPKRWDEAGKPYACTADDAAYSTFELENGVVAHFNSSWTVRVRRDDLLTLQVDGTHGSAVAGLRDCWIQPYGATPRPVWNPDVPQPLNFFDGWQKVPEQREYDNAFKVQWEKFLRHVVRDEPFQWGLLEGAKGVQLADLGLQSSAKRAWVKVPALKA